MVMVWVVSSAGIWAQEQIDRVELLVQGNIPHRNNKAIIRLQAAPEFVSIPVLSWDTEGGDRAETNLLRNGAAFSFRVFVDGTWIDAQDAASTGFKRSEHRIDYTLPLLPEAELRWSVQAIDNGFVLELSGAGDGLRAIDTIELVFPFDPGVTPTTVIPKVWHSDGSMSLPVAINAPDFGQMLLVANSDETITAELIGSRENKTVDFVIRYQGNPAESPLLLTLTPVWLDVPKGMAETEFWLQARRGWFGALEPSAEWGDSNNPFSAPSGILANNVVSDPASCSLWFYADQALWTPEVAPGISVMDLVRRSIDWWLDERMHPSGEMICYWDHVGFLDANAGPLIAAWDYVEATGDTRWLGQRLAQLENAAEFLVQRDIDNDGMVEAVQSGNPNTLRQPHRSCAWWDALNCGHKDGYTNALIYRAWCCLADLESRLGRSDQATRFHQLASKLKAAYQPTLYNPETGWLAWWKSEDGRLHDYASPTLNGLAIEYGLVEPELGKQILARFRDKMNVVGFQRFDLGVPPMLMPVLRSDYLQPSAIGLPTREDGTDTFQQYMNGGITAGHVLHFIAAHYVIGERERGDFYLREMLKRQAEGGFQNGVRDSGGKGIDWTTWNGEPCGYEGFLADSFRFLQAVLLREPVFRERYYRPLSESATR